MPKRSKLYVELEGLKGRGVSSDLIVEAKAVLTYLREKGVMAPTSAVACESGNVMLVYDGKDVELEIGEREIVVVSPDMSEEGTESLREASSKLKDLLT
jgi:hypothetical protein